MKKHCELEIFDNANCQHNPQYNWHGMTINAPYDHYIVKELEDAEGYLKQFGNLTIFYKDLLQNFSTKT